MILTVLWVNLGFYSLFKDHKLTGFKHEGGEIHQTVVERP